MPKLSMVNRDLADVQVIGVPRALLYYRYGALWTAFLEGLGKTVRLSPETDRGIVEAGTAVSIDECCLASKAYFGHVLALAGSCDAVFVPCYASGDSHAGFCTKFQSAPDLVANTLRDEGVRVASLLVEDALDAKKARAAFVGFGLRLGASAPQARDAWKAAVRAQRGFSNRCADAQRNLVADIAKHGAGGRPVILVVAHPYISHDRYLSGAVLDALADADALVLFADETDRAKARKASADFSETMPWAANRELIGSILLLQDAIDGIVLISAFPCGPDSMTDDAVMRCIQGTPILNLMIDAQSGTAGVATRVESFIDILQFQRKGGYLHG